MFTKVFIVLVALRFHILKQTNEGQGAASRTSNTGDSQTVEGEPDGL